VAIRDRDRERLFEIRGTRSVPELAKLAGLPYLLIYNVVHGRVKTLSDRHYRLLFEAAPPPQRPHKVDGEKFRRLVRLWLFLNDDLSKADLYREFYGRRHRKQPDYRIFNGQVRSVDVRLERLMLKKFQDAGLDQPTMAEWLDELEKQPAQGRVPYEDLRPTLIFLQSALGVHPNAVLKQSLERYESGQLKQVAGKIYEAALALRERTEAALAAGSSKEIERIRESLSKAKPGYTLYVEIEEEVRFLQKYAQKGAKHYLGRSRWAYEQGKAKRIENWRARQIMTACDQFIHAHPQLPLAALPATFRKQMIRSLLDVLVLLATRLFSREDGILLEKRILSPSQTMAAYKSRYHGFTQFDRASDVLGMRRKAFDLMVATNCEIFRSVGTYAKRWYLSNLYLRELSQKQFFDLITVKYELLAKGLTATGSMRQCLQRC
jgi:hypothetical protein